MTVIFAITLLQNLYISPNKIIILIEITRVWWISWMYCVWMSLKLVYCEGNTLVFVGENQFRAVWVLWLVCSCHQGEKKDTGDAEVIGKWSGVSLCAIFREKEALFWGVILWDGMIFWGKKWYFGGLILICCDKQGRAGRHAGMIRHLALWGRVHQSAWDFCCYSGILCNGNSANYKNDMEEAALQSLDFSVLLLHFVPLACRKMQK